MFNSETPIKDARFKKISTYKKLPWEKVLRVHFSEKSITRVFIFEKMKHSGGNGLFRNKNFISLENRIDQFRPELIEILKYRIKSET